MQEKKLYTSEKYKKYFAQQIKKIKIDSLKKVNQIKNGFIAVDLKTSGYGVFSKNGDFISESLCLHNTKGQFIPKIKDDDIPFVNEDVVYLGGDGHQGFGHFLTEGMARAYVAGDKKFSDMKFVIVNPTGKKLPSFFQDLFIVAGIDKSKLIVLEKTTRFKNVWVPKQGINLPVYGLSDFADMYNNINKNAESSNLSAEKIYMSRAKMTYAKTHGEEAVQKIFENNGYKIVYPETLSLENQIKTMKNCAVLAGAAGSALHLALFMKPGGKVIQLRRTRKVADNANVQCLINDLKKSESVFIDASIETTLSKHGSKMPQIIGFTPELLKFWDENGFIYDKSDIIFDDAAMTDYKSELSALRAEIGSPLYNTFKKWLIKIVSMPVPGRSRRGEFRKWLKSKL